MATTYLEGFGTNDFLALLAQPVKLVLHFVKLQLSLLVLVLRVELQGRSELISHGHFERFKFLQRDVILDFHHVPVLPLREAFQVLVDLEDLRVQLLNLVKSLHHVHDPFILLALLIVTQRVLLLGLLEASICFLKHFYLLFLLLDKALLAATGLASGRLFVHEGREFVVERVVHVDRALLGFLHLGQHFIYRFRTN